MLAELARRAGDELVPQHRRLGQLLGDKFSDLGALYGRAAPPRCFAAAFEPNTTISPGQGLPHTCRWG